MLSHKINPPGTDFPDTIKLKSTVNQVFKGKPTVVCQVGANDGVSADPVFDIIKENENIEAHLIEPQKDAFALLTKNYDEMKERVYLYNYALTNKNEKIKLYKNTAVNGTDGHSSLLIRDEDRVNDTVVAKYTEEDYELVEGITVDILQNKIKKNIDLLVIDTEGYDIEILKMFINYGILPKVIYFEKPGITGKVPGKDILTGNVAEKYIYEKLIELNYVIEKLEDNFICVKQ